MLYFRIVGLAYSHTPGTVSVNSGPKQSRLSKDKQLGYVVDLVNISHSRANLPNDPLTLDCECGIMELPLNSKYRQHCSLIEH